VRLWYVLVARRKCSAGLTAFARQRLLVNGLLVNGLPVNGLQVIMATSADERSYCGSRVSV
jgi:hypothetical protein